jgi:hypothetical protein
MDTTQVKPYFNGFGPITTSKTTHMGGFGIEGSFVPLQESPIKLRSDRNLYQPIEDEEITYPFRLTVVNVTVGGVNTSKVRIQYGEIDGVPPSGLTLDSDYLLDCGNAFIYLIVTFDGNGRINSRTIGYSSSVPADADSQKHIVIGQVALAGGLYEVINQNIAQDVYPEKALVVDRSNDSFVYSLFADPRKINAIYELENFNVNLNGSALTTRLYLKSEDNAEYLELKKNSQLGECSVYGYSRNNAQNFIISANDTAEKSKIELYDSASANFFTSLVDSTSKVSVRGYSNNEEQQFLIEADSVSGASKSTLFDGGSANYLECKVDTDDSKTSVYGYAGNNAQNFILAADNTADKSTLTLFDSGSANYIEIKETLDVASVYGYMNNQNHNFLLKAQAGKSQLELFNEDSDAYVNLKQQNSEASLYAYVDNEAEYFILKAKAEDTQLYLGSGDNYVKIDIPDNDGTLLNAFWQEIDICVDGVAKKMKVLGTAPYDPPA